MKQRAVIIATGLGVAMWLTSCASLPSDQVVRNSQTRFDQQLKGYPDRENSAQQNTAEARARLDELVNKKSP